MKNYWLDRKNYGEYCIIETPFTKADIQYYNHYIIGCDYGDHFVIQPEPLEMYFIGCMTTATGETLLYEEKND